MGEKDVLGGGGDPLSKIGLSPEWQALIRRLWEFSPASRFPSWRSKWCCAAWELTERRFTVSAAPSAIGRVTKPISRTRLAEHALAHVIGDKAEQAYRRSDALARRRELMDAWPTHCEGGAGDNVVAFRRPA
jgi:hypothetical protein